MKGRKTVPLIISLALLVFAAGALNAAVFISGKEPGMYDMSDLISD